MSGEGKDVMEYADPATTPVDLASAFKMYNEANKPSPGPDVADDGDGGEGQETGPIESDEPVEGGSDTPVYDGADASAVGADTSVDTGSGGSSDVIEPVALDARRKEILTNIQQQAIREVRKDFSDNKVVPCSIEDLYQRDENTGMVTFKNPDNPNMDFNSRAEAQQWVDAFNKQIEMRFRQDVNKKQQELVSQSAPMLRLLEFAQRFESLDENTKFVLDDLIEPYAVKDGSGNVIGYNCDLNAMANQAQKISKRFAVPAADKGQAEAEQKQPGSRPAMNMPTGNSDNSSEAEPKTVGEALKLYDKQQREKAAKAKKKGGKR